MQTILPFRAKSEAWIDAVKKVASVGSMYSIPINALPKDWQAMSWYKDLIVTPKGGMGLKPPKPFNLSRLVDREFKEVKSFEHASIVQIPRFYGLQTFGCPLTNSTTLGEPMRDKCVFTGTLIDTDERPQVKAVAALTKELHSKGGAVLKASCGIGKTVIAIATACFLRRRTMIVVTTSQLMEQFVERIRFYAPQATVGIIRQDDFSNEADFVVASLQTILSRDYDPSMFASFGLVVFDEVHFVAARAFSRTLRQIPSRYILGLTATPNRADGLGYILDWIIGKQAFEALAFNSPKNALFCTYTAVKTTQLVFRNGEVQSAKMITKVSEEEQRTRFIVDLLHRVMEMNPRRKVIILTDRRQHADDMLRGIKEEMPDIVCGMILGGSKSQSAKKFSERLLGVPDVEMIEDTADETSEPPKKKRKTRVKKIKEVKEEEPDALKAQIIVSTYAFLSVGTDIPSLDTIILATPRSNIQQSVGRIMRECPGKCKPLVIDIIDPLPYFISQSWKRKAWLKGETTRFHNISDTDFYQNQSIIDTLVI